MVTLTKRQEGIFARISDSDAFIGLLFVAPFAVLWVIWFFIPLLESVMRSFQDANFISLETARFIGLGNYFKLFEDRDFFRAITNSVLLVAVAVPVQTILALLFAMALNRKMPGKGFFRTQFFLPYVTSPIAVATVFMILFTQGNFFSELMSYIGFPDTTWTADLRLALPFVMILYIWQQVGFFMVIYLAGLQGIPRELYEACQVDGANAFQKFLNVTLPVLRPVTSFVVTVGIIYAFQIFDQVAAISRYGQLGSPAGRTSTLITYFIQVGIREMEIGLGSASVVVFFLLILAVTMIQRKLLKERDS
jgi:multiple sugar transport system permease protein